ISDCAAGADLSGASRRSNAAAGGEELGLSAAVGGGTDPALAVLALIGRIVGGTDGETVFRIFRVPKGDLGRLGDDHEIILVIVCEPIDAAAQSIIIRGEIVAPTVVVHASAVSVGIDGGIIKI